MLPVFVMLSVYMGVSLHLSLWVLVFSTITVQHSLCGIYMWHLLHAYAFGTQSS